MKRKLLVFHFILFLTVSAAAQQAPKPDPKPKPETTAIANLSDDDIISQAWAASAQGKMDRLNALVNECVSRYQDEALSLQEHVTKFPGVSEKEIYKPLNNIGTCLFIQAEATMNRGKKEDAIAKFKYIIKTFPWAQAWDPRGWFWSVKEKSQDSIDVMLGKEEEPTYKPTLRTKPKLFRPGKEKIVDYLKYGEFIKVGTDHYHYRIKDIDGLKAAVGEGIYPDITDTYKNPEYKKLKNEGRLKGSHWDFVNTDDLEAAYFKWFTAPEPWGVRLFYLGMIFEKAKMYYEAIKAYQALIVHYPKTIAYTYWQTPWYPAQAAIAKIQYILRIHPELGLEEKWMSIKVKNGYDNDPKNDVVSVHPGKIIKKTVVDRMKDSLGLEEKEKLPAIKRTIGKGKVQLVQYRNGDWRMLVDGKPYMIRGVTYNPTKVGQSPDKGTLKNWMEEDDNGNGLPDGPFDAWVDANKNNKQDPDEKAIGDFELMKEMGINTIRLYNDPSKIRKSLLRKLYEDYGIRVVMGDFLGKYAIGSGASWAEGTDYTNPEQRKKMLERVKKMVKEYKDEPYILLWVLGNENNYGVACNADKHPAAFYKFANEVAKWIKKEDPNHPVAVNNGDTLYLDLFAKNAPDVDIFSANVYRGDYGFGSFWEQVKDATGKPAFITEYGAPAYGSHMTLEEAEQAQADYLKGNWLDIQYNSAGYSGGSGNALGGMIFEWLDEWWKNYEPYRHDRKSDAVGPFPGGYYYEEWFGIMSQGNGQHSPFLRQPRKAYYMYKDMWTHS